MEIDIKHQLLEIWLGTENDLVECLKVLSSMKIDSDYFIMLEKAKRLSQIRYSAQENYFNS